MPLRPDVRLSDAPTVQAFRIAKNIDLHTCYLKNNEAYNSIFAIIVPSERDVEMIVESKLDSDTILTVQEEIVNLYYSFKVQRDPQSSQFKLSVTGLHKSANPLITVTAFSMSAEFLWALMLWKLAALQFPLTYIQKTRTENEYGLG